MGQTADMPSNDLIGTADAAAILQRSQRTVKRLAKSGKLEPAVKMTGDTGAYLFERSTVEAFAKQAAA